MGALSRNGQPEYRHDRRDTAIVATVLVCLGMLLVLTSADGEDKPGGKAGRAHRDPEAGIGTRMPAGWRPLPRPVSSVLHPPQVLAAASFPVFVPPHPRSCAPTEVLDQMPADGALLGVFEYTPRDLAGEPTPVPRFEPAPRRFRYGEAERASFECAGRSYRFEFERGGRAFQAHVWLDPGQVNPRARAAALRVLDRFRPLRERG